MVDGEAPLTIRSTGDALSLYKKSFTGAFFASYVWENAAVLSSCPSFRVPIAKCRRCSKGLLIERIVNSAAKVVDFNNCLL